MAEVFDLSESERRVRRWRERAFMLEWKNIHVEYVKQTIINLTYTYTHAKKNTIFQTRQINKTEQMSEKWKKKKI